MTDNIRSVGNREQVPSGIQWSYPIRVESR